MNKNKRLTTVVLIICILIVCVLITYNKINISSNVNQNNDTTNEIKMEEYPKYEENTDLEEVPKLTTKYNKLVDEEKNKILSYIAVFYNVGSTWYCDWFCSTLFNSPIEILNDKNQYALKGVFTCSIDGIGDYYESEYSDMIPPIHKYTFEEIELVFKNILNISFSNEEINSYFIDCYDSSTNNYYFMEGGVEIHFLGDMYKVNDNEFILEYDVKENVITIKMENDRYYIHSIAQIEQ